MDMLHNNNERLIRLRDIDKRYHHAGQELSILRGVSLEVARGESCAILGSSGSGKSTLLNVLGLLDRPSAGDYHLAGQDVLRATPDQLAALRNRLIGFVFQSFNLLPRLSALDNVALPLGYRGVPLGESRERARAVLEQVGLAQRSAHRPADLSGGQRQRVAIARALLAAPRLLLMDEPLAALDLGRKREILPYLQRLHDELEIPVVYVTHSPDEVARLADHLVLFARGRVLASGALGEVLPRLDLPTALADRAGVVVEAAVRRYDGHYGLLELGFPGGQVQVPHGLVPLGSRMRLQVRARDVSLARSRPVDSSITNILPATVVEVGAGDSPAHVMVRLDAGGTPLLARITRRSRDQLGVAPGMQVWAQIKAVALLA